MSEVKRRHERAVAENLLSSLGKKYTFVRMGNDRDEPDVIFKVENITIGIEVATAYYEDIDAKQAWTLARGKRKFPKEGYELRWGGAIWEPDQKMCERIQNEVSKKVEKNYVGADEVWLCIDEHAPITRIEVTKNCASELTIPENGFSSIYILHHNTDDEGSGHTAVRAK